MKHFRELMWSLIFLFLFSLASVLVFQGVELSTNPAGWERIFQISAYDARARNVRVTSRGNLMAAVYETAGGMPSVWAVVSFNAGGSFSAPARISAVNPRIAGNPSAAVSGSGRITIAWEDYIEAESSSRIFSSFSEDMGATWSKPARINLGFRMEMMPRVYYDDAGVLHLFYLGDDGEGIRLYHAMGQSAAGLENTGYLVKLDGSVRGAFFPAICMSGGNIYMVWQGKGEYYTDDLFFMRSKNGGKSWSGIRKITEGRGSSVSPSLALHRDVLYLAYQSNADRSWSIKLRRGLDFGGDWKEKPFSVSTTSANCYFPRVAVSDNDVFVSWYDVREGSERVFARRFPLREKESLPEVKVSERKIPARNPAIIASGPRVVVFWEEGGVIMARPSDVYVEPPNVYSATHPVNAWSRRPVAVINWKSPPDESGIAGYAVMVDGNPYTNPPIMNEKPYVGAKTTPELEDGVHYFHIRSFDGAGNASRTVHYRLQVCSNPLPLPSITSPTHPEGRAADSDSPLFRWNVDGRERLKGFLYNISRQSFKRPDVFTTDFEKAFSGLKEGGYFFTLAAVDKTNQIGQVANYYFIVGRAEEIDIEKIKKIARGEVPGGGGRPSVFLTFPFDVSKPFGDSSFRASIGVRNLDPRAVDGYSISVARAIGNVPAVVNHRGSAVEFTEFGGGDYFIGIRCRYAEGGAGYRWTEPGYHRVRIDPYSRVSPLGGLFEYVRDRLAGRFFIAFLCLAAAVLAVGALGFGRKIDFYFRLFLFRTANTYRLIFGRK